VLRLKKGDTWTLGADKKRNDLTLDGHPYEYKLNLDANRWFQEDIFKFPISKTGRKEAVNSIWMI